MKSWILFTFAIGVILPAAVWGRSLGNGIIATDINFVNNHGKSIVVQPDGRILVAASSEQGADLNKYDFALLRYNSNGAIDSGFGTGGLTTTNIASWNYAEDIALRADGRILIGGYVKLAGVIKYIRQAVVRYNSDGSLETGFSGDGKFTDSGGGRYDYGYSVSVQPDGKTLLAGSYYNTSTTETSYLLIRLDSSGAYDTGFSGDGKVILAVGSSNPTTVEIQYDSAQSLALQPDGKIVLGGYSRFDGKDNFSVARLNSDGTLDTGFAGGGKKIFPLTHNGYPVDAKAYKIALQPDGKIIMAGTGGTFGASDIVLLRMNSNGSLDSSFNGSGFVLTDHGFDELVTGITLQKDGKLIVAWSGSNNISLTRYNANGSLDTTFGSNGTVSTPVDTYRADAAAVTLQSDGKILVAGTVNLTTDNDIVLVRYNPNGTPDTSFNAQPVDGACGASNGGVFTVAPVANLCSAGTPTAVTGTGPWYWSCNGINSSVNANCSAAIMTYPLNLTFAGNGDGVVNGDIACTSTTPCPTKMFVSGTSVSLLPSPDIRSIFSGWSGACTNISGTCNITMNGAKSITANFSTAPNSKVGSKTFATLQDAYNDSATSNGSIIMLLNGFLANTFTAGRSIDVMIKGGYNAAYSDVSSETSNQGPFRIKAGTVRVSNVTVR